MKSINSLLKTIKNSKKQIVLSVIIDLVFIFIFFSASAVIFEGMSENIIGISGVFQEYNSEISEDLTSNQDVRDVLSDLPDFSTYYQNLLQLTFIWFILLYICWSLFQGVNFWLAQKKTKLISYLKRFFLVNILWIFCIILLFLLTIRLSVNQIGSFVPVISQTGINIILLILFLILGYFVLISYSIPLKKTFKIGIKNWKKILPVYGISIVSLVIGVILFIQLLNFNYSLGLFFALVILLPLVYFLRVYVLDRIERLYN